MGSAMSSVCNHCQARPGDSCNHQLDFVRSECDRWGYPSDKVLREAKQRPDDAWMAQTARSADKYWELRQVLLAVLAQASAGKGKERHANGERWENQRWARITSGVGPGFLLGQAIKKLEEAQGFEDAVRIERELLGAMHYTAMAIYHYNQRRNHERTQLREAGGRAEDLQGGGADSGL